MLRAARFPAHVHGGGEEFLVLDGVFQDEHGDFPAGAYIRNPPQSPHTPGSAPGCTIFVKLWQFDPDDRTQLRLDTTTMSSFPPPAGRAWRWCRCSRTPGECPPRALGADAGIALPPPGGIELLVLDGEFSEGGEAFTAQSWLRLPAGAELRGRARRGGCRLWVKEGHLAYPQSAPAAAD